MSTARSQPVLGECRTRFERHGPTIAAASTFVLRVHRFAPDAATMVWQHLRILLWGSRLRSRLMAWDRTHPTWPEPALVEAREIWVAARVLHREHVEERRTEWDERGRFVAYDGRLTARPLASGMLLRDTLPYPDLKDWIADQLGIDILAGETRRTRLTLAELPRVELPPEAP